MEMSQLPELNDVPLHASLPPRVLDVLELEALQR